MSHAASLSGLYVITDPSLIPQNPEALSFAVKEALMGGARIVQYRNKTAPYQQQLAEATALRSLTKEFGAIFLINDSLELCLASDADGIHIGQKDGSINDIREQLGQRILGVTCHNSLELAEKAIACGADYCAFGAMFPSPTKPQAQPCSLATLNRASKLPVPICAIGGIDAHNAPSVRKQGAQMLAVISGVFGQTSIRASAQALASLF